MPVTMPSSNLPAASLSTLFSFPAGRPGWSISNYLKYRILSSIIRRFSGRGSRFLPALREARVGGQSSCPPVALSIASAPAVAADRPTWLTPLAIAGPQCNQQSGDEEPVSDGRRHGDDPDQNQECSDQRQGDDDADRQRHPENGDEDRQQHEQEDTDDHPDDEVEEAHRSAPPGPAAARQNSMPVCDCIAANGSARAWWRDDRAPPRTAVIDSRLHRHDPRPHPDVQHRHPPPRTRAKTARAHLGR